MKNLDSRFWTGILVGGVATLLLIFGIVVVGSAAMGGPGAMMPMMMNGMMDAEDMEAMHERCHEMMDERTPAEEPPEGEDASGGGQSGAAVGGQSLLSLPT